MTHEVKAVKKGDCISPDVPPPGTDQEPCEGQLSGSITGTVTMDCCCPRLVTRTFILNVGPQSEVSLISFVQNTVNAYEASGYLVFGHSVADIGAGWVLGLSVGWYQP